MKQFTSRAGFFLVASLMLVSSMAMAQTAAPNQAATPAKPASANQLTPQMLGAMLQSAATFHELVENMNLKKSFGTDEHVQGPDGQFHHSMERTAQTIGAGAGVGAAVGGMTHSQNGVLIGALVGGAGGLIIDEILKHREETADRTQGNAAAQDTNVPREFKQRDPAPVRQTN